MTGVSMAAVQLCHFQSGTWHFARLHVIRGLRMVMLQPQGKQKWCWTNKRSTNVAFNTSPTGCSFD